MTPDDFALSAVPLRGALAPLAALLGDGARVDVDDCDPHVPGVQCHACAAEE